MINIEKAQVKEILRHRPGYTEALVEFDDAKVEKAINYDDLTGPVRPGDRVYLNTSAVRLGLGTGGYHFIMINLSYDKLPGPGTGHIMKMRYAPSQVQVLSVEEEDSPHRRKIEDFESLDGTPVVIGTLHSLLAPAAAGIHKELGSHAKIAYVMTDGAALPLQLSNMVAGLKVRGLISKTVTIGHAFGGDLEAVNIYSGLSAAKAVLEAEVIIVTMGPGIVGTGTVWGFSGIEQGEIINAVNILGGKAICLPRLSFADQRERHRGISHHTLTVLEKVALTPAFVTLPLMDDTKASIVQEQIKQRNLTNKHHFITIDGEPALDFLQEMGIKVVSMGRSVEDDPEFFTAGGAAGIAAAKILKGIKVSDKGF